MRKLTLFLTIALVLTFASGLFAQATNNGLISIDNVTNLVPGDNTKLRAGSAHVMSIRYTVSPLVGKWSTANAWEVYSPEGADWVDLVAQDGPATIVLIPIDTDADPDSLLIRRGPLRIHKYYTSTNNGVSYTGTTQIPNPIDPETDPPAPYDRPIWFEQPGGNPTNSVTNRVGYSWAMIDLSGGGYSGVGGIVQTLQFSTLLADAGKTMCVDSVNSSGTVNWGWNKSTLTDRPKWDGDPYTEGVQDGPHCWEIFEVLNISPVWCEGQNPNVSFHHCGQGSYDLCATDEDNGPATPLVYSFAPGFETGFGELVGNHWTWSGPTVPQSGMTTVEFQVWDGAANAAQNFQLHVTTTNTGPTVTCNPGVTVGATETGTNCDSVRFFPVPEDCDPMTITVTPPASVAGDYEVVHYEDRYYLKFCPLLADALVSPLQFTINVSDGDAQFDVACGIEFNVIIGAPYGVVIQKDSAQVQGVLDDISIKLKGYDPNQGLGGFDFLIAYDASALAFQLAFEGDIYNQDDAVAPKIPGCGWEYFTYRFGPYGNCGSACPSGMLRVIGMAEANNGPYHPDCQPYFVDDVPITLVYLRFLVSNDRTLECSFVPIRFFWYNCGDNTLSNFDGSQLFLSARVYDFQEYGWEMKGDTINVNDLPGEGFPTYQGAQDTCICEPYDEVLNPLGDLTCKIAAKRYVDFQNGGVDIACADSIDARGDINLNGLAYEIADAVMFTNYFIEGIGAFGTHIEGSIAASDTNADGLALTVADLVYLIRVVIGDAVPYDKVAPVAATVTYGNGVFNVDAEMGAAFIVMSGNVAPNLLAGNMEIKSAFDGENTRILVFSLEGKSFSGNFLGVDGTVVSTEFASANGQPVVAKLMPANFAVHQNYPNPFNPTTTIKMDFPKAGLNYTLNIYNVTGQLVETMSGKSTGYDEVVWDASKNASGIYFYKVTAGDYSATKKAILLK